MGILSKLAGKAIKEGIEGGLKGRKTKALLTRPELPPEAPAAPLARETTGIQPTPTPADITSPTTALPPITPAPPVAADKQARMIMLQGADEPIKAAPPITPIDVVPPVREEMGKLMPSVQKQIENIQGKREQEIIQSTINEPLYHTSRSPENIETFDTEKLKDKAIKGNVSSGEGLYTTPSLEYSRGIYYSRIVPEEIQTKYINKGEAHKIWEAEKLYRRGEFSPEEIEDLVYDAHTYKINLREDFNPIVILGNKDKTNKLSTLTLKERTDFLIRNPNYQEGSPIIKHKGIWKSQQELEEMGFEGVIDARQKFKRVDEEGKSKHEVAVWPSALSKVDHELMRGIGAREGVPIKKRINVKTASREEIREHYRISTENKATTKEAARDVELEEAAKQIEAGTKKEEAVFGVNKNKTWDELVKEKKPIKLITEMPIVPSPKVIDAVLQPTQAKKGILVQVKEKNKIEGLVYKDPATINDEIVSARIDINTRDNFGIWVDTIHEPKPDGSPGNVIGYTNSVYLKDVTFHTPDLKKAQEKAVLIAQGKGKNPFAGMTGTFKNKTLEENYQLTKKALDQQNKPQGMKPLPHLEWVQIGMNPKRGSYFYDKKTGQPILTAKEVVQVGPLVFARDVKRGKASDFTFNKGGVVDMRNGGRVGAAVVAASLMANGGQTFGGIKYNPDLLRGTDDDSSIIDYATPEEQEFDPEASKEMDALLAKRYAKEQPAAPESKPTPDTFKGMYEKHLKKTEGDVWHEDTKGIFTSPYGLRADFHKEALEKMRVDSGVETIQQIPKQNLLQYAVEMLRKAGNQYSTNNKTRGFYSALSDNSKFLLSNATYNTGQVFSELAKSLSVYEKNKNVKTLSSVVKETRRYSGTDAEGKKIHTKGADNRAVRDLVAAGVIKLNNKTHMQIVRQFLPKSNIGIKSTS